MGVFRNNHWNSLFFYDTNKSKENILHIDNIDLVYLNKALKDIEDIEINDLYIKFTNQSTYYPISCFNCSDTNNTIKLAVSNQDINQSKHFSLVKSSYAIKLENETLFLYHNFKQWLQEPYKDKSILIDDVQSFTIKKIKETIIINICLNSNLCTRI